ncbi:hypothetical protein SAMN05519103_01916 [Rhizobiales bacterium GAS113]|nr:hypothetical protein SAMN05519103_01916 [Rhizobiales bacterium GAS113]
MNDKRKRNEDAFWKLGMVARTRAAGRPRALFRGTRTGRAGPPQAFFGAIYRPKSTPSGPQQSSGPTISAYWWTALLACLNTAESSQIPTIRR